MKMIIFVMDNLYEDDEDTKNFVKNEDLAKFYKTWNEIYVPYHSKIKHHLKISTPGLHNRADMLYITNVNHLPII